MSSLGEMRSPGTTFDHTSYGTRGVVGDKWPMRILWVYTIGSAISLYMVAIERQKQNRDEMMAESLNAME